MSWISSKNVHIGKDTQMGQAIIIEDDVYVGDRVKLGHRVTLKSGTHIDDDSIFGDHCISTGACWIGKNVNVRTGAIISKATIIEDWVFVGPGVVTNHTKHVSHGRSNMKSQQLLTYIGYGSIIGSQASLLAGVRIAPFTVIGGGAVLVRDAGPGIYLGSPAKWYANTPSDYSMDHRDDAGFMYDTQEILNYLLAYIPYLER